VTELRRILAALGEPLVEVVAAPRGLGVPIDDVVILDPEDPPEDRSGDLVLVIGARGRAAIPVIRAAGRAGAAAVAVKTGPGSALTEIAAESGVALLAVRSEARWEQLESLARGVVAAAKASGEAETGELLGDLFSLAQTVATLTGGLVSIEDTESRVLAYSRAGDEVDELRRLSILGRQGPERYLAMLRDWGVYQRLRAGEGIVRIEERPELGIRRRIAAGIHAGTRPLGSIWVQEGATPFTERAEQALLGASRTLAPQLVRLRTEASPDTRLRQDLLVSLLDGRLAADTVADEIGADPSRPVLVAAFSLPKGSGRHWGRAELVNLIALHAAAYRRGALVGAIGGRLYALLPDLTDGAQARIAGMAAEIAAAARRHLDAPVRAALGGVVPGLADSAESRTDADRVLDTMARGHWTGDVASLADVRSQVLLSEVRAFLGGRPRMRDPHLDELVAYDDEHAGVLVPSLLAYLDAFGDVRAAAGRLTIHPNTLRYRVRRAAELAGLDLTDPDQRLLAHLQLRL
jgi:DNA-binding PucR family transcriptional regulator